MTWIVIQTKDWLKEGEPFTPINIFMYVLAVQKKGRVNSTVRDLAYTWMCTEPKVTKLLDVLRDKGLITYLKQDKDITIDVINHSEYPVTSHQMPVAKVAARPIREVKGKLPLPELSREENMAVWIWRSILKVAGETHKSLNNAYLEDWTRQIKLMKEIDGRDDVEMVNAVKWALTDEFWGSVLRSANGLRKHYDKIVDKMNAKKKTEEVKPEVMDKGNWQNKKEGEI